MSDAEKVERITNAIMGDMLGQALGPAPAPVPAPAPTPSLPEVQEQDASLNLSDVSGELLHTEAFGEGGGGGGDSALDPGQIQLDEQDESMNLSEVSGTIHVEDFAADE